LTKHRVSLEIQSSFHEVDFQTQLYYQVLNADNGVAFHMQCKGRGVSPLLLRLSTMSTKGNRAKVRCRIADSQPMKRAHGVKIRYFGNVRAEVTITSDISRPVFKPRNGSRRFRQRPLSREFIDRQASRPEKLAWWLVSLVQLRTPKSKPKPTSRHYLCKHAPDNVFVLYQKSSL
jgi:hypothetical protein